MVGNSSDGSASRVGAPAGVVGELEGTQPPVLGEVSEAELDAFVSKLRTDKNALIAPAEPARSLRERMAERFHRGGRRPLVSCVPEAARHAWYAVLGGKASGPHDVETLKARWERGELGPDSLCWREGFPAWVPVCQVPDLAEALVPLPQEWLPETLAALDALDEVEIEEAPGVDFVPTDVEALRSLAMDAPEPVTQVPLLAEPEAERPTVDPVGTHALAPLPVVAARENEPAREKSRGRGVVWLSLVGGVAGGVTVALVLALLSTAAGRDLLASVGMGAAGAGTAAAPGASGVAGVNAAGAPGVAGAAGVNAAGAQGVAGAAASNGATAPGAAGAAGANGTTAPGVAGAPGATAPAAAGAAGANAAGVAGLAAVDRGGSVPVLAVAAGATAPSNVGPTAPPSTPLETQSLPQRAPGPRAKVPTSALALEKRASETPPAPEPLPAREREEKAVAAEAEAEDDLDLGPDEDFERELAEPPAGVKAASKPTVFVPPSPGQPPVSLAQSDVFEVVLANKGDITACASAQPQKESGRVVVRWSILPSGKVDDVVMETDSVKGTPLAGCIEAKVRAWTFPKHQEQGAPVRFPFVF